MATCTVTVVACQLIVPPPAFPLPCICALSQSLELNPRHRLVQALKQRIESGSAEERTVRDLVWLLYDTALLVSGFSLPDPGAYANRIHKILAAGLGVQLDDEQTAAEEEAERDKSAEAGQKEDMPPLVDEQQATVMEEVD